MATVPNTVPDIVLDDRLLIEELLVGLDEQGPLYTTTFWYYRACRAAISGAGGHLSGPFLGLDGQRLATAIRNLLMLPDTITLPDSRSTVPLMAKLSERHPRLNLLNLQAAAAGLVLHATVLLSIEATRSVLPGVFDAENVMIPPYKVASPNHPVTETCSSPLSVRDVSSCLSEPGLAGSQKKTGVPMARANSPWRAISTPRSEVSERRRCTGSSRYAPN